MPRRPQTAADLNALGQNRLPGLLGFDVTQSAEGRVEAELRIRPELLAPNGFLHGGTVIALAHSCCGYGAFTTLPDGATGFTTIELKTNFLGTVRDGLIRCVATPAHLGRTTQVWDAVVTADGKDKPLAQFRCTQLVLWPRA
jgi:1,4-dihydroxy-2-naphthoyl-CoA hydrolase